MDMNTYLAACKIQRRICTIEDNMRMFSESLSDSTLEDTIYRDLPELKELLRIAVDNAFATAIANQKKLFDAL